MGRVDLRAAVVVRDDLVGRRAPVGEDGGAFLAHARAMAERRVEGLGRADRAQVRPAPTAAAAAVLAGPRATDRAGEEQRVEQLALGAGHLAARGLDRRVGDVVVDRPPDLGAGRGVDVGVQARLAARRVAGRGRQTARGGVGPRGDGLGLERREAATEDIAHLGRHHTLEVGLGVHGDDLAGRHQHAQRLGRADRLIQRQRRDRLFVRRRRILGRPRFRQQAGRCLGVGRAPGRGTQAVDRRAQGAGRGLDRRQGQVEAPFAVARPRIADVTPGIDRGGAAMALGLEAEVVATGRQAQAVEARGIGADRNAAGRHASALQRRGAGQVGDPSLDAQPGAGLAERLGGDGAGPDRKPD